MKSLFVHDIIQSCFESHTFFSPFCSLSVFFPSYWDYSCPDQIKLDTNVYPTYPVPLFCLQSHAGYRPLPTCMSHLRMAQAKEKRNPKSDTITRIGTPPPSPPLHSESETGSPEPDRPTKPDPPTNRIDQTPPRLHRTRDPTTTTTTTTKRTTKRRTTAGQTDGG